MTKFYSSMYGSREAPATAKPTVPAGPAVPPPAHQRLSGLKLSNSHMHAVQVGNQQVNIPSAAYVKLLEDQIKELRSQLRETQNGLRRLTTSHNRVVSELDRVKLDLNNKVNLR